MFLLLYHHHHHLFSLFFPLSRRVCDQVFEWPTLPGASVLLIGIANGLDLTDRVLPFLKAQGCHPQTLNFSTYTKQQVCCFTAQEEEEEEEQEAEEKEEEEKKE